MKEKPIYIDERAVAEELAQQLVHGPNGWSWARVTNKLSSSVLTRGSKLAAELRALQREDHTRCGHRELQLVVQPDIDVLLKHRNGRLHGIEVKWFRGDAEKRSFHEGLGEALALLAYGLDYAALWLVFEKEEPLRRYGSRSWFLTRNELRLALDFTPLLRIIDDGRVEYRIWQYDGLTDCHDTGETISRAGALFSHENPLRRTDMAETYRRHLDSWLEQSKTRRRRRANRYHYRGWPRRPRHRHRDATDGTNWVVQHATQSGSSGASRPMTPRQSPFSSKTIERRSLFGFYAFALFLAANAGPIRSPSA
jgi:hypothetical protein